MTLAEPRKLDDQRFPFHLLFDRELRARLLPKLRGEGFLPAAAGHHFVMTAFEKQGNKCNQNCGILFFAGIVLKGGEMVGKSQYYERNPIQHQA